LVLVFGDWVGGVSWCTIGVGEAKFKEVCYP